MWERLYGLLLREHTTIEQHVISPALNIFLKIVNGLLSYWRSVQMTKERLESSIIMILSSRCIITKDLGRRLKNLVAFGEQIIGAHIMSILDFTELAKRHKP